MSRLHWLPRDLRRLIGSFVDDLRPLRKEARNLANGSHLEVHVLTDRTKLERFNVAIQTFRTFALRDDDDGMGLHAGTVTDRALHDAVVDVQSPVLWNLLCQDSLLRFLPPVPVRASDIVHRALEHRLDPSIIFTFVDPVYLDHTQQPQATEWADIQDHFLELFMPAAFPMTSCAYGCDRLAVHTLHTHLQYGAQVLRHYIVDRVEHRESVGFFMRITLWFYLAFFHNEPFIVLSALNVLIDQHQVFTRDAFAIWLWAKMNNGDHPALQYDRLQWLYKWATT